MAERLLRTTEVMARVGISRTCLWQWERDGKFPRRRVIGGGMVAWLESEVDGWIADRQVGAGRGPAKSKRETVTT